MVYQIKDPVPTVFSWICILAEIWQDPAPAYWKDLAFCDLLPLVKYLEYCVFA